MDEILCLNQELQTRCQYRTSVLRLMSLISKKICTEVLLNDERFKASLQKVTVGFVMSVCPLSTWNFGSHRMEFYEILYLSIFKKSINKS
jgi:hypothetical protein